MPSHRKLDSGSRRSRLCDDGSVVVGLHAAACICALAESAARVLIHPRPPSPRHPYRLTTQGKSSRRRVNCCGFGSKLRPAALKYLAQVALAQAPNLLSLCGNCPICPQLLSQALVRALVSRFPRVSRKALSRRGKASRLLPSTAMLCGACPASADYTPEYRSVYYRPAFCNGGSHFIIA